MTDKNTTSPLQQMVIDFGPLVIFFATYKFYDLYIATAVFMVAIIIGLAASKIMTGQVSGMLKFTFVIVMVMGGLTLYLRDDTFVKMKPTIVYGVFAAILGISLIRGQLIIKNMLSKTLEGDIDDTVWQSLTKQAIGFFAAMMVVNELVWRTQTTDTWVSVKVFGFTAASFGFTIWLIINLMKHMPEEDIKKEAEE